MISPTLLFKYTKIRVTPIQAFDTLWFDIKFIIYLLWSSYIGLQFSKVQSM